jgi:ABC-type sugar transport system ATPase subunit
VTKRFGNVIALHPLSLELRHGTVYGLAGENGAGKSTLIKLLAGVHKPDSGEMRLNGSTYSLDGPAEAVRHGISVFHQEVPLCLNLSVADNVFLGESSAKTCFVNRRQQANRCRALLQDLVGLDVDPLRRMGDCTVAERQLALLARVLAQDARLVLLDEPTTALSPDETARLFGVVRQLASRGITFVFISHLLDELMEICDEILVLRDGALAGQLLRSKFDAGVLAQAIAGRRLPPAERIALPAAGSRPILEVRSLTRNMEFAGVSFRLQQGEVLGIAGNQGSGRSALARALFGSPPADSGEIRVEGKLVHLKQPRDAVRAAIGYVPEDRKTLGLFDDLDVQTNLGLLQTRSLTRGGLLGRTALRELSLRFQKELQIKVSAPDASIGSLSGGNQQKVLIARWLTLQPKVLVMNEPARGVDVGAKDEIYRLIRQQARAGRAFIVASSDLDELLRLCDRILVLRRGRLTADLPVRDLSKHELIRATSLAP